MVIIFASASISSICFNPSSFYQATTKITVVLGTRPEIVKMSPVIRSCTDRSIGFSIIHTGQHYSYEMDRVFFRDLELPDATYNLEVGSGTHGIQVPAC